MHRAKLYFILMSVILLESERVAANELVTNDSGTSSSVRVEGLLDPHTSVLAPTQGNDEVPSSSGASDVRTSQSSVMNLELVPQDRQLDEDAAVTKAENLERKGDSKQVAYDKLLPLPAVAPPDLPKIIISVPPKSWIEIFAPVISALISLLLGWGFSVYMFNKTRKNQVQDRDSERQIALSDEFWLRKTIFPMFQHRLKTYCEKSVSYWDAFDSTKTPELQSYLEYDVQAEHHNLLFMLESIQPTVAKILPENIVDDLIDVFDELEKVYAEEFPKLSTNSSDDDVVNAVRKFKQYLSPIEYRALAILHKSLENSIGAPCR